MLSQFVFDLAVFVLPATPFSAFTCPKTNVGPRIAGLIRPDLCLFRGHGTIRKGAWAPILLAEVGCVFHCFIGAGVGFAGFMYNVFGWCGTIGHVRQLLSCRVASEANLLLASSFCSSSLSNIALKAGLSNLLFMSIQCSLDTASYVSGSVTGLSCSPWGSSAHGSKKGMTIFGFLPGILSLSRPLLVGPGLLASPIQHALSGSWLLFKSRYLCKLTHFGHAGSNPKVPAWS